MKVRLIAKTSGYYSTEYEGKSLDEIVVGIARISSNKEVNELFSEPYKLIRHCISNGHWSIFNMANLTFEIVTSRAIGRELLRHWSIKPQEFSQRYSSVIEFEPVELRQQAKNNRQSSTKVIQDAETCNLNSRISDYLSEGKALYTELLESSVAKESARFILPETAQTTLIMNGTIREWITTLNQRLHKTAQKEARLVAEQIRDIFIQECPIISKALFNFGYAQEVHILDRVILEKYKMFDHLKKNLTDDAI